jgi:putative flippase GtrA
MTSNLNGTRERARFLKFAAVGAVGSVVDFGVMNLLTRLFSMRLVYAGTISFLFAVINNFTGNRYWTYPESRSKHILHQLGMFFVVNAAGIAIRIPILHFVEPPLEVVFAGMGAQIPVSPEVAAKNATLALAIGIVMLWNFFVNRYWTYNDIE